MGQIASKEQLRMSLARWALVCVPGSVFLGFAAGRLVTTGYENRWFMALDRPDSIPPGWVFGTVWATLYAMLGLALAIILNARGAPGRRLALTLFGIQFAMNLAWNPLFFGAHQVTAALVLIVAILATATATTFAFAKVRKAAAWLLVPYLVWLSFASVINFQVDQRNPNAETLVPEAPSTQIML